MASLRRIELILETSVALIDAVASSIAIGLVLLMLMSCMREANTAIENRAPVRGARFGAGHPPCDDIYVVTEGETLHSISDKCGDPYIVQRNPHINDPDDVYPGLVLQIIPAMHKQ